MPSDKQRNTARRNGAKSHGAPPKPARFRDSLDPALLARTLLVPGESRKRFDNLAQSLHDELQPGSTIERMLIQKIIAAHWRQMRLWTAPRPTAPAQQLDLTVESQTHPPALADSAAASETSYDRQFTRALAARRAVQAGRKMRLTGLTQEVIANNEQSSRP